MVLDSKNTNVYSDVGEKLKNALFEVIENEHIEIEYRYEMSFMNAARLEFTFNSDGSFDKKTIVLPRFTDDDDLTQAATISHELGHYYVYKNSNKFKNSILIDSNLFIRYFNEKLAWKEAEKLIRKLGYWEHDFVRTNFEIKKKNSLMTYKPRYSWKAFLFHNIQNLFTLILKVLILSYLMVGVVIFFGLNSIPVPFMPEDPSFYDISRTQFFSNVETVFWVLFLSYVISLLTLNFFRRRQ